MVPPSSSKWFRYRRFPSWRLWLILIAVFGGLAAWLLPKTYGWLAVTERIPAAKYVVVEGWVSDYVLVEAQKEFDDLDAKLIFTTGIPLDRGMALADHKDYATLAATILAKNGMEPGKICPAPAPSAQRDRTATMAIALKSTLDAINIAPEEKKIQLITSGTHARRSRLLYQRLLGPEWTVGVVSIPDPTYPKEQWYRHSSGAKSVIDELAALTVVYLGGE
jgi:hypothetical protein